MNIADMRDPSLLRAMLPDGCPVCGGRDFAYSEVLLPGLVDEWQLSPDEADYINVQQGVQCRLCGNNLRSIVLARAICAAMGHAGTLTDWIASPAGQSAALLEINEAGGLTRCLRGSPGHRLAIYPAGLALTARK
jgi:hypothetical protein